MKEKTLKKCPITFCSFLGYEYDFECAFSNNNANFSLQYTWDKTFSDV